MGKGCCYTTSWFTTVCIITWGLNLCSGLPTCTAHDMQHIRRQSEWRVLDVWWGFRKVMEEGCMFSPQTQLWCFPTLLLVHPAVKECPMLAALALQNASDRSRAWEGFSTREKVTAAQVWHCSSYMPSPGPPAASVQNMGSQSSARLPARYQLCHY